MKQEKHKKLKKEFENGKRLWIPEIGLWLGLKPYAFFYECEFPEDDDKKK